MIHSQRRDQKSAHPSLKELTMFLLLIGVNGTRKRDSITAATKNVAASYPTAACAPAHPISTPATAGDKTFTTFCASRSSALASRSASLPTSCLTIP